MSDVQKDTDQNMDDILASIRKIISDDGASSSGAEGNGGAGSVIDQVPLQTTDRGKDTSQIDDLSDILEQPSGAQNGVKMDAQPARSAAANVASDASGEWSFNREETRTPAPSGSLTDKLASLGSTTNNPVARQVEPQAKTAQEYATADVPNQTTNVGNGTAAGQDEASLEDTLDSVRKAAAMEETASAIAPQNTVSPNPVLEAAQSDIVGNDGSADSSPQAAPIEAKAAPSVGGSAGAAAVVAEAAATAVTAKAPSAAGAVESKSLEMLVTEALKPMLQQWLDANLARLVDEKLQEELKNRVK